jgi:hypothetical protein
MPRTHEVAQALRSRMPGKVLAADAEEFDRLRRVWNAAIDRQPCAIARCADLHDIQAVLNVAHDHGGSSPAPVSAGSLLAAGRAG